MKAALTPVLTILLLGSGCDSGSELPSGESPVKSAGGGEVQLASERYPFDATTCTRGNVQERREFIVIGRGKTPAGQEFDIQADGQDGDAGRIELRVRSGEGELAQIYILMLEPGAVRADGDLIAAEGKFNRAAEGDVVAGKFQVRCS